MLHGAALSILLLLLVNPKLKSCQNGRTVIPLLRRISALYGDLFAGLFMPTLFSRRCGGASEPAGGPWVIASSGLAYVNSGQV
jgi:hypothetical protein